MNSSSFCHCAINTTCLQNRNCEGFCKPSWRFTGVTCKKTCPDGLYLRHGLCDGRCHCSNQTECNVVNGYCGHSGCHSGWEGFFCDRAVTKPVTNEDKLKKHFDVYVVIIVVVVFILFDVFLVLYMRHEKRFKKPSEIRPRYRRPPPFAIMSPLVSATEPDSDMSNQQVIDSDRTSKITNITATSDGTYFDALSRALGDSRDWKISFSPNVMSSQNGTRTSTDISRSAPLFPRPVVDESIHVESRYNEKLPRMMSDNKILMDRKVHANRSMPTSRSFRSKFLQNIGLFSQSGSGKCENGSFNEEVSKISSDNSAKYCMRKSPRPDSLSNVVKDNIGKV